MPLPFILAAVFLVWMVLKETVYRDYVEQAARRAPEPPLPHPYHSRTEAVVVASPYFGWDAYHYEIMSYGPYSKSWQRVATWRPTEGWALRAAGRKVKADLKRWGA